MKELNLDYYAARLRAERAAAATASSEEARAAHQRLAEEYAELLAANGHANPPVQPEIGTEPPPPGAA